MTNAITSPDSWTIGELINALEAGSSGDKTASRSIEIPQFQRKITWRSEKQRSLIVSIYDGFPIGSLLVYQNATKSGRKEFLLVDGLQRATSIWSYHKAPLSFFLLSRVGDQIRSLEEEIRRIPGQEGASSQDVWDLLESWKEETKTTEREKGFDTYTVFEKLKEKFSISDENTAPLRKKVNSLLTSIEKRTDIKNEKIPIIVYEGEEKHLPHIFKRINTGSVQLSKYQILAAEWITVSVETDNEGIRSAIRNKYQNLEDEGFKIRQFVENRTSLQYSLYEYLFGLGKVISERYDLLFSPKGSDTEESVAFALATMVCQLPISKMSKIHERLPKGIGNSIEMREFTEACHQASKFVTEALDPVIGLRLNSKSRLYAHSANQIISMISRCVVGMYDVEDWSIREEWKDEKKILERTLQQHYLVDALQNNWGGSGDNTLFRRTWTEDGSGNYHPSGHYLEEFSKSEMENIISGWFSDQLRKKDTGRSTIQTDTKLFMKYLYSTQVSHHENSSKTFEIEHLFPVVRLSEQIDEDDEGWPINCVGNLALFVDSTNRKKNRLTLHEYIDQLKNEEKDRKINELEGMLFCDYEDVKISESFGKSEYESFLRSRFQEMKAKIIEILNLEDMEVPTEESITIDEYSQTQRIEKRVAKTLEKFPPIEITPSKTIFGRGYFGVPSDYRTAYMQRYGFVSGKNKSEKILVSISGNNYNSSIRYLKQRSGREIVQFVLGKEARIAFTELFHQSFLELQDNLEPTATCKISVSGKDVITFSKIYV